LQASELVTPEFALRLADQIFAAQIGGRGKKQPRI
jgi:hypothetical protein